METFLPIPIFFKINKVKIMAATLKKQTSSDRTSLLYEKELNSDVKPRISNKLYILDPIMFPTIMLDFPFLAAVIDVAISGKDVPRAIIVKPINESEIFRMVEIDIAESTVTSAPKSVIPMEPPATGNP